MSKTQTFSIQAVVYLRGRTQSSLDRQLTVIRERAERDGVTITRVYSDLSTSPRDCINRDQMLADVASGECGTVYIYHIDRLSRDFRRFLQIVRHLKQHNVTLRSVLDEFDTSQPEGRFMLAILDFAKVYRPAYCCKHQ